MTVSKVDIGIGALYIRDETGVVRAVRGVFQSGFTLCGAASRLTALRVLVPALSLFSRFHLMTRGPCDCWDSGRSGDAGASYPVVAEKPVDFVWPSEPVKGGGGGSIGVGAVGGGGGGGTAVGGGGCPPLPPDDDAVVVARNPRPLPITPPFRAPLWISTFGALGGARFGALHCTGALVEGRIPSGLEDGPECMWAMALGSGGSESRKALGCVGIFLPKFAACLGVRGGAFSINLVVLQSALGPVGTATVVELSDPILLLDAIALSYAAGHRFGMRRGGGGGGGGCGESLASELATEEIGERGPCRCVEES